MKKNIILLLIFLVFFTIMPAQAEKIFIEAQISQAVREVAELKDENLIIINEPPGKVALEVDSDQELSKILAEILAGTGYRAVPYSSYYLIGEFSHDSAEFASQSETIFYQTDYLSAEILAKKIDTAELRVQILADRDELLIQGLPEDIQTVRARLADLDTAANLNQIKYSLTVIDLTEEKTFDNSLEQITLSSEETADFEFVFNDSNFDILFPEIVDSITGVSEKSKQKTLSIANPSLITEVGSTASLNMSEEILSWTEDELETKEIDFSTELTPINVSSKGEIETEVEFLVNSGTDFSTVVNMTAGQTELIGFLKMNENKVSSDLKGVNKRKRERTYAIYLSSDIAGPGPAARLNGLDNLIFNSSDSVFKLKNQYLQIVFSEDYLPEIDFQFQAEKNNVFNFKSRSGLSYLEFGLGFPIYDGLFLDTKALIADQNELSCLLGIVDKVQLGNSLSLSAGLYPVVFSLAETEFDQYAAYANLNYLLGPLVFKLSYSHNLEAEPLRFETGVKFKNYPYLMAAVSGNSDGVEKLLVGLRFEF